MQCNGERKDRQEEGNECVIEVTVTGVTTNLSLTTQRFLPSNASDVLKAHELGHVKICKEIYKLVAEKEAKETLGSFPASFKIANVSPCETEEIQKRMTRALTAFCKELCDEISKEIFQTMDGVGQDYDSSTENGTKNSPTDDEATASGQDEAATKAIDDFKEAND